MRRVSVPGHDVVRGDDRVQLEWEQDGAGYRALFTRQGEKIALEHVEQRARPPLILDAGLEVVPRALLDALQRHGYEVVVRERDAEEAETAEVANSETADNNAADVEGVDD